MPGFDIAPAAQPPRVKWSTDRKGEQFVSVPEVCGPFAWAQLHSWAKNLNDQVCPSCGQFAIEATKALHDVVNTKLGKRVHDPENLRKVAAIFGVAARGEMKAQAHQHENAKVAQFYDPKTLGRVDWMSRLKVWRVIWYYGEADIPIGDFPTQEEALDHLRAAVKKRRELNVKIREMRSVAAHQHAHAVPPHLRPGAQKIDVSGTGKIAERVLPPGLFDKASFRTVTRGAHALTLACPKGKFDAAAELCKVQPKLQNVQHPRAEETDLLTEALSRKLPVKGDATLDSAFTRQFVAAITEKH